MLGEWAHLSDGPELHNEVVCNGVGYHRVVLVIGMLRNELAHPSRGSLQLPTRALADENHVLHHHSVGS